MTCNNRGLSVDSNFYQFLTVRSERTRRERTVKEPSAYVSNGRNHWLTFWARSLSLMAFRLIIRLDLRTCLQLGPTLESVVKLHTYLHVLWWKMTSILSGHHVTKELWWRNCHKRTLVEERLLFIASLVIYESVPTICAYVSDFARGKMAISANCSCWKLLIQLGVISRGSQWEAILVFVGNWSHGSQTSLNLNLKSIWDVDRFIYTN